jgi:hypothetical protein
MRYNVMLWIVQGLLAVVFLFAGGMKLVLPLEALAGPVALPGPFIRFIGVAEVAGAAGLILPSLLRVRPDLTPVAAGGLVMIMTGATVITIMGMGLAPAIVPLIVGLLAALVVYGRGRLIPITEETVPSFFPTDESHSSRSRRVARRRGRAERPARASSH